MTKEDEERYERHLLLENGWDLQEKLLNSKALIVGVGGLGSPAAYYLTAAGVGTIGLVDGDKVSLSNLQRQILHTEADLGRPKVVSAKEKLQKLNGGVTVKTFEEFVSKETLPNIISEGDYDIILDCTDNFPAKYLINDVCVSMKKTFIHGGVSCYCGQAMLCTPGGPSLRSIFPTEPEKPSGKGILSPVPGVIGSLMATLAIRYLTNESSPPVLYTFDAGAGRWTTLAFH